MGNTAGDALKILTFNHHESFLCTLAGVGHEFDVVQRYKGLDLSWNRQRRDVPANFRLIDWDNHLKLRVQEGYYDLIILHTVKNLLWFLPFRANRFLFIAHIPLYFDHPLRLAKALVKRGILTLFRATRPCQVVAVSSRKLQAWHVDGQAIPLAPAAMPQAHYAEPLRAVAVGNHIVERGEELGAGLLMALKAASPITTVGVNAGLPDNLLPVDFCTYREALRDFSIYVYTVTGDQGDGYNTAMLEAMAMGMAVVTIANPSSPIEHGVNGLVGQTKEELLGYLQKLQGDAQLVRTLGEAARRTVEERFSGAQFLVRWREAIIKASGR